MTDGNTSLKNAVTRRAFNSKADTELSEKLLLVEARIEKLAARNLELERHKAHLEGLVDDLLNSASWKLTKPLRTIMQLKRQLWPLFRLRTFAPELKPGRGVALQGEEFVIQGSSPSILLSSDRAPSHWVRVRGRVKCEAAHLFLLLYYRTGEGFTEDQRAWLGFEEKRVLSHLVRLPSGVKELRLDPFATEGRFQLLDLTITEIGSIQAFLEAVGKQLRGALYDPLLFLRKIKKAAVVFREGGFAGLRGKLFGGTQSTNYQEWVEKYDTLTKSDRSAIQKAIENLRVKPLISVVMPVYNTPEKWLCRAIDSTLAQIYQNFELCIADDASTEPHVKRVLEQYAKKDKRIKVCFRKENGHISAASNSALEFASGEYVALLDHDDELTEDALFCVAAEINRYPDAGLIYSDEDKITGYGLRVNPYFKSDWNPDLLRSQNYVCHLSVFKSSLVKQIGGFRTGFEGAQDWDLILRAAEKLSTRQIRHIPHVLYHWRIIEGSTAQATAYKPYVLKAQAKAVSEHLQRSGVEDAKVEILEAISHLRVRWPLPKKAPLVSIVIPTRDMQPVLARCVDGILAKTTYSRFEVLIVDNGSCEEETLQYFKKLSSRSNVKVIRDERPFNFSALNNGAAAQAQGDILGFLNNDLDVISEDWLGEMVSHAVRSEVGAVGARLLYPNGLLQHGGIVLGIGGVAGHNHKGRPRHDPGYFNRAILTHNFSAVTAACLLTRRQVFNEVKGFDETFSVAFNDVDLCLRIREAGYLIVYDPYAEFFHHESASRGYENTPEKFLRFEGEIKRMKERWQKALGCDPYYNPNLTLLTEDFNFAFPPRCKKPWLEIPAGIK